jgi:hypothetical protein
VNLVDANVLLYAVNASSDKHERSRSWLDGALSSGEPLGLSWIVVLAFLRLSTKVGIHPNPLSVEAATAQVEQWLRRAQLIEPTSRHLAVMAGLLAPTGAGGNLVNEAHLAALAIEHNATIVSFDDDFARFPGVRWNEPPPLT